MTNEEAIKVIEKYIKIESFDRAEAFGMAVQALSNSDEDCISRSQALKCFTWTNAKDDVYYGIKALPSIQPKTGHWEQFGYSWEDKFKCSECGEEQPKILCGERIIGHWSDYCPNCGADMRENKETE